MLPRLELEDFSLTLCPARPLLYGRQNIRLATTAATSLQVTPARHSHRLLVGSLIRICSLKSKTPILDTGKSFKLSWLGHKLRTRVLHKGRGVVGHSLVTNHEGALLVQPKVQ